MSPGLSSAWLRAWLSSPTPARSCCAVAGRSAHIRTESRVAVQRNQRVHGAGRLDIEREPRAPDALGGIGGFIAAVARDLELRHRGALRRRERNFEIPRGTVGSIL